MLFIYRHIIVGFAAAMLLWCGPAVAVADKYSPLQSREMKKWDQYFRGSEGFWDHQERMPDRPLAPRVRSYYRPVPEATPYDSFAPDEHPAIQSSDPFTGSVETPLPSDRSLLNTTDLESLLNQDLSHLRPGAERTHRFPRNEMWPPRYRVGRAPKISQSYYDLYYNRAGAPRQLSYPGYTYYPEYYYHPDPWVAHPTPFGNWRYEQP